MTPKKPSVRDRAMLAVAPSPAPESVKSPIPAAPIRPKTGPGSLVAYLQQESEVAHENAALKTELSAWSDALPARKIDPALISVSEFANRHQDSFSSAEFKGLKSEISKAGGNVQPIKVRPVPGANPQRYEVIFGHRRLRACQDLGLPVLAVVESITDQALFVEMDRENRNREDLRPFEQGSMYARALDRGLYPSQNKLAEAVGLQPGNVSTALKIARLPVFVLDAFASPLDIQYRWATPLAEAVEKDPKGVAQRAEEISAERNRGEKISAAEVLNRLIERKNARADEGILLSDAGKIFGTVKMSAGRYVLTLERNVVTDDQMKRFEAAISKIVDGG